jgi:hypothetical protein
MFFKQEFLFALIMATGSWLLIPGSLYACDVRGLEEGAPVLCGVAKQGGLLYGELSPEWNVYNGDEKISMNGIFVIGLGRDHPENLQLRFCKTAKRSLLRGGDQCSIYTYNIKSRTYKEQNITVSRRFDELSAEVQRRIESENTLIRMERAASSGFDATEFMNMRLPDNMRNYRISGVFGTRRIVNGQPRRPHLGVDIAAPRGTKVKSVADGQVIITADMFFNGKTVFISHGHGITTAYMHLESIDVQAGDVVMQGDVIGRVGSTGRSTGPHLHLGAYWRNIAIDPQLGVRF